MQERFEERNRESRKREVSGSPAIAIFQSPDPLVKLDTNDIGVRLVRETV